jgi:hypothetical protein
MDQQLLLRFADLAWNEIAPGAREKSFLRQGKTVRLLQLSPGFEEVEWCRREHLGFVLAGSFEVLFPHHVERFEQGDGIAIPAGEGTRHRTIVGEQSVTLFLVDPHTRVPQ